MCIVRTVPDLLLTLEPRLQDDRQNPEPHNQSPEPEHSQWLREWHKEERQRIRVQHLHA